MPKYVIERAIPGAGNLPQQEPHAIAQKSVGVLSEMGPQIYALHIWLWRENPAVLYTSYNPTVACPAALASFPNAAAASVTPHGMPGTSGDTGPLALIEVGLLAGGLTLAGWLVQCAVRRAD